MTKRTTYTHSFRGISAPHTVTADGSVEARIGRLIDVQPDGCWVLPGEPSVYPSVWGRGRVEKAYRFVYETLVGPIPEGHHAHHVCRNKRCCNPEHIEIMTPEEHAARHRTLLGGER